MPASLRKEHPLPALGERRPWDAAVPHWSAGPVESAGCHTNLPLVPGQPGREVPGRAGAKGRIRSQGQAEALPAREASIRLCRRAGWHRWALRHPASPRLCSPPLPATSRHGGGRREGTARGSNPDIPLPLGGPLSRARASGGAPPADRVSPCPPPPEHPRAKVAAARRRGAGPAAAALPGAAAARSAGLHRTPMPAGSPRAARFSPPPGIGRCSEGLGGCVTSGRGCGWVLPQRWELEP